MEVLMAVLAALARKRWSERRDRLGCRCAAFLAKNCTAPVLCHCRCHVDRDLEAGER